MQLVGQGGFSKVYKAKHIKSRQYFALKAFDLKVISQASLTNIQKEIEIHSKLNSSRFIQFYGTFKDG